VHDLIVEEQKAIPAPLNYAPPGYKPFPKSICTSVNHQVCHGIPGDRVLKAGDILNVDVTVIKDGYHGDSSRMFYVGEPSIQARDCARPPTSACGLGIRKVFPGAFLGDVGAVIQQHAEGQGYSVVREFLRPRDRQEIPRGTAGSALRGEPERGCGFKPG